MLKRYRQFTVPYVIAFRLATEPVIYWKIKLEQHDSLPHPQPQYSHKVASVLCTKYVPNTTAIRIHSNSWNVWSYTCIEFYPVPKQFGGTRWRSWLRHCATSREVAGSNPDGVIGIFHWHNPPGHTVALGSTQPPTEMSTRNISWG